MSEGFLTFAGPRVVQVKSVAYFGPVKTTLGGKELTGCVICLIVSSANLK